MSAGKKILYVLAGIACLLAGAVGLLLPILPGFLLIGIGFTFIFSSNPQAVGRKLLDRMSRHSHGHNP